MIITGEHTLAEGVHPTWQEKKTQELQQQYPIYFSQKTERKGDGVVDVEGVFIVEVGGKSRDFKISSPPTLIVLNANTRAYIEGVRGTEEEIPKKISVKVEYCESGYQNGMPIDKSRTTSYRENREISSIKREKILVMNFDPAANADRIPYVLNSHNEISLPRQPLKEFLDQSMGEQGYSRIAIIHSNDTTRLNQYRGQEGYKITATVNEDNSVNQYTVTVWKKSEPQIESSPTNI